MTDPRTTPYTIVVTPPPSDSIYTVNDRHMADMVMRKIENLLYDEGWAAATVRLLHYGEQAPHRLRD